jgi:hypothetical protein
MVMRSMEALRRDQGEILSAMRADHQGRERVAQLPRPGTAMSITAYGKVASVVTSDATYGPYLMVTRYVWRGMPPTASAASSADVRCYPPLNRIVSDYSVGDDVRMMVTSGAVIAEPIP